jgi:minimal PKS chain-length factor (CLF/KS beta)
MRPGAVITGLGVIAPTGVGVAQHWEASLAGECRISPFTRFPETSPVRLAGQVKGFDEQEHVSSKLIAQTDRFSWYALAACQMAFDDAGLDPQTDDPYAVSVVTAATSGGNDFGQRELQALWAQRPESVSAFMSVAWFYAASSGQISILHKLKGACGVFVADTAGGLDAFGQARRVIGRGGAAVVVGGAEAPLTPYALVCQASLGELSGAVDPAEGYRPFDSAANGFVPGEGGAMVIVEEAAAALSRGAVPYAEILGHAATHDAYHHANPAPDGYQLSRAISTAIRRAGLTPADIDVVFADAAGSRARDAVEVASLRRVFGDHAAHMPVTAPKSMVGRLYSGGGPLDVAWAALTLRYGVVPPTINLDPGSAGYGLAFVVEDVRLDRLRTALVVARGIGGFNSALVLGAPRAP